MNEYLFISFADRFIREGAGNAIANRSFYSVLSYLAMNASGALIQTTLLFSFKCQLVSVRTTRFTRNTMRSPVASLPFKGQVTEQTTKNGLLAISECSWPLFQNESPCKAILKYNFFPRFAAGCTFDVIGSIFGQQQLVMVNYACGFNQSETGKYFERIIIAFTTHTCCLLSSRFRSRQIFNKM